MFFYNVINKLGSVFQGWVNENYPAKSTVLPRVYHKYVKDDNFANIYPIGKLTVESADGSSAGTTAITVSEDKANEGNTYVYKCNTRIPRYKDNLKSWTAWDGTADITPAKGDTIICIAEIDQSNIVVAAGSATLVVKAETVAQFSNSAKKEVEVEDDEDPQQV